MAVRGFGLAESRRRPEQSGEDKKEVLFEKRTKKLLRVWAWETLKQPV
jgi:hypothetical protein